MTTETPSNPANGLGVGGGTWREALDVMKASIAQNGQRDPTDAEILATIGLRHHVMTYVIRNILWMAGFRRETPWIRRQLMRLEREGRVVRVSSSYATQICWAITPEQSS